jgi:hypothetical protein
MFVRPICLAYYLPLPGYNKDRNKKCVALPDFLRLQWKVFVDRFSTAQLQNLTDWKVRGFLQKIWKRLRDYTPETPVSLIWVGDQLRGCTTCRDLGAPHPTQGTYT